MKFRHQTWRWGVACLLIVGVGCGSNSESVDLSNGRSTPEVPVDVALAREAKAEPADEILSDSPSPDDLILQTDDQSQETVNLSLQELRKQRDETVWQKETLAQEYEQSIVRFWDELLAEQRKSDGNQLAVFADLQLNAARIGRAGETQPIRWGATVASLDQNPQDFSSGNWSNYVHWFRDAGYRVVQTEWHHAKFDMQANGAAKSTVSMAIYAEHPQSETRYVVSGDLLIEWKPRDQQTLPIVESIDATALKLYSRRGEPAFVEILTVDHATPATRSGIQPVVLRDMDGDGLSEILLGGSNELFWNQGGGEFEKDQLFTHPQKGFEVGLVADVTGDAVADFLLPGMAGDLLMYVGDHQGRFSAPAKGKVRGGGPLKQPQVIAAGDVDQDGDLDLWIGQYKISYVGGQMPSPYYDANDGFPAFFLINQGGGKFAPQTEEAGFAKKRQRRSYGGSFVDLDADGDLDLLVVSDFAGIDVYFNDGKGYFTDVTDQTVDERHLFGMSATFADYNVDGRLDFFATGMASTTARRLEYLRLGRRDRPDIHMMRSRMGYGNRMYLASAERIEFSQPSFKDSVARTGWTWGSTSFDFDNDGYPDIFVANGHSSGKSTKDHCSHFWCHDIYDADSKPDLEVLGVFNEAMKGYFDRSESWDGYQKNQLLVNLNGSNFVNLGFLMGVGHEYDGRAVVSDDIDGDGRLDLLVVEDRWQSGQILHVYQNRLETDNHWIGIRLVDRPGVDSPLGATVLLTKADGTKQMNCVTAGDSIHAQHAPTVHFGLGSEESVKSIDVRLVSGKVVKLEAPMVGKYHAVSIE